MGTMVSIILLALITVVGANSWARDAGNNDSLYIGDVSDDTVKRFDATTGVFLGVFVTSTSNSLCSSGHIHGPRGLIFGHGSNLLVSNQNANDPCSGDILRYNGQTGGFLGETVPLTDLNAPPGPRGIILSENHKILFVANVGGPGINGKLQAFTKNGKFLADLNPSGLTTEFHPRGVVIGPDGLLYVSNTPVLGANGGQVLRFDPKTLNFVDVFISDLNPSFDSGHLNRPEGLVFGPDGKLYVTSFRANTTDLDSIRIYDGTTRAYLARIELDQPESIVGQGNRAFAQALLFGPEGRLFVPISGNGPDTGQVRRYNMDTKTFDVFVSPGGYLGAGWFLTFGETDPATLEYGD